MNRAQSEFLRDFYIYPSRQVAQEARNDTASRVASGLKGKSAGRVFSQS